MQQLEQVYEWCSSTTRAEELKKIMIILHEDYTQNFINKPKLLEKCDTQQFVSIYSRHRSTSSLRAQECGHDERKKKSLYIF